MTVLDFEIRAFGVLPACVLDELEGVRVVTRSLETVLQGPVPDQPALIGIIDRLQGLGVELRWSGNSAPAPLRTWDVRAGEPNNVGSNAVLRGPGRRVDRTCRGVHLLWFHDHRVAFLGRRQRHRCRRRGTARCHEPGASSWSSPFDAAGET